MNEEKPSSSYNFMGVRRVKFEDAGIIILPVPYEGTVTYGSGTRNGPKAIIEASKHVEFYDDELDCEPYVWGIHTLGEDSPNTPKLSLGEDSPDTPKLSLGEDFPDTPKPLLGEDSPNTPKPSISEIIAAHKKPDEIFQSIKETVAMLISSDKLLIALGGEHSITPGVVAAFAEFYSNISVLQLDAHADLRNEYNGTKYNHACAMRRVLEYCPAVQVGIRSLSQPEKRFIDREKNVFFMRDIRKQSGWIDDAINRLTENVYVTIDLDVFDPSIMPSVGTPEPGGMLWDEMINFLSNLSGKRRIVGFDVVELSPQPGNTAPDFLAAKVIYKLIGYIFSKRQILRADAHNTSKPLGENSPKDDKNKGLSAMISSKDKKPSYVLQLTDSATKFECAMRIDHETASSFREIFDRYVKTINKEIMAPESAKNLSVIQDCIYNIDDNGELMDIYEGLIIKHDEDVVDLDDEPTFQLIQSENLMLLSLTIDRSQITEEGNPYGYNIRKWRKNEAVFERFVRECIAERHGAEADRIMELDTNEDKEKFLYAVGKKIWDSDFELYSRFIGDRIWFKDPAEALNNIIAGRGGTCTEKSSAMKLITDVYGFESEYLLGGPDAKGPFPTNALRKMLETLDFELGKKYMIYWQHMALLYSVDGEDIMIDVTNGNVPFLFLKGEKIEELLRLNNKKSVSVRMIMNDESFYYHVTPQDIPENLLAVMQDWIDDVDLINVFDDGLGLLIREDYYVWPVMYRDEDEKMTEYNWWLEMQEKNFKAVELLDNYSLPGGVAGEFNEKYPQKFVDIIEASEHLTKRYNESYRESEDTPEYNVAFMFVKLR